MEETNLNDFKHHTPTELRFSDFDMFGHVNNAVYQQLMDVAKVRYFAEVTGKTPSPHGTCPIVANININYDFPTLPGERIAVFTRTSKIGQKSITLEQCIVNTDSGQIKCRATVIMVNVDLSRGNTVEIADDDRASISRYEGRDL